MSDLKTKPNQISLSAFLKTVEPKKKEDTQVLLKLMQDLTKFKPVIWGKDMVGFGEYHYKYDSGCEGDWFLTGFSPRKQNYSIYIMPGFNEYKDLLSQLGKHKTGKSCLYINKLSDIDLKILKKLVSKSVQAMKKKYNVKSK